MKVWLARGKMKNTLVSEDSVSTAHDVWGEATEKVAGACPHCLAEYGMNDLIYGHACAVVLPSSREASGS